MCEARLCNMKEGNAFSTLEKDWAIKSKDWWCMCGTGWNKEFSLLSQCIIFGGSWKRTRLFRNGGIWKEAMSKDKKKVVSNHFRWLPPMHTTMLILLAEETTKGNKSSNTFKAEYFAMVAKAISTQFEVECYPSFVENRLHTLWNTWTTIQTLRQKSGFGWDDNLKMITCDAKTYQEEVMAHWKHGEFLNKKIEMYDELTLVIGKDITTGSFAKSYVDLKQQQETNLDDTEVVADNAEKGEVDKGDKGKNVVESSTTGSIGTKSRKRGRASCNDDNALIDLSSQLKEIAVALKDINNGPINYNVLYLEVMAMAAEGYSEEKLGSTFDYLC